MKQYKIFEHPIGKIEAVKQGWSWPAFFIGVIWTFFKRMWALGVIIIAVFAVIGGICGASGVQNLSTIAFILSIFMSIVLGLHGNDWREKNLQGRGYEFRTTVTAANTEGATSLYIKEKQDIQEKYTSSKPQDSKAENLDAFYTQAWDEINDQNKTPDKALWAKSFADAQGNESLAKANYVRIRAEQLSKYYLTKERERKLERQCQELEKLIKDYKQIEGQNGDAFCIICRKVSPINGMFHHKPTDTYYHKNCLLNKLKDVSIDKIPTSLDLSSQKKDVSNDKSEIVAIPTSHVMIVLGCLVLFFIIIPLFSAILWENDKEKKAVHVAKQEGADKQITTVSAFELALAYEQNTVSADQRFKGKRFRVTGTVVDINTDFLGNPYIVLRGGVNEFSNPQFAFDKKQGNILANLSKGDKVVLECKGNGDIAKIPMSDSCVFSQ